MYHLPGKKRAATTATTAATTQGSKSALPFQKQRSKSKIQPPLRRIDNHYIGEDAPGNGRTNPTHKQHDPTPKQESCIALTLCKLTHRQRPILICQEEERRIGFEARNPQEPGTNRYTHQQA